MQVPNCFQGVTDLVPDALYIKFSSIFLVVSLKKSNTGFTIHGLLPS